MRLEVGSGYNPNLDFDIHLDINPRCKHLEIIGTAKYLPFTNNSFESIRASDILEHFSYRDTLNILCEWFRVLQSGGMIFIQCPDAKLLAKRWVNNDLPIIDNNPMDYSASYWICGGQEDNTFVKDGDDFRWNTHYVLLSPESLRFYLEKAGFIVINIYSDGGSNMMCTASK